jgi:hypothetical protein
MFTSSLPTIFSPEFSYLYFMKSRDADNIIIMATARHIRAEHHKITSDALL